MFQPDFLDFRAAELHLRIFGHGGSLGWYDITIVSYHSVSGSGRPTTDLRLSTAKLLTSAAVHGIVESAQ